MENTAKVEAFIKSLGQSIDSLEPVLDQLLSKPLNDRLTEVSSPLERIKLTNGYTYILTSLLFAYLKSRGVDTNNHEIMAELNRCKSYMKRLKDLEASENRKMNSDEKGQEQVERLVRTQLSGNSTVVTGVQKPAISSVSFEGKHTKFTNEDSDNERKYTKKAEKYGGISKPKGKSKGKKTKSH